MYASPLQTRMQPSFKLSFIQLAKAIENRVIGHPEAVDIDMLSWMGRTALELIGQAGLGYSFDSFIADSPDDFGTAVKAFQYVSYPFVTP